MARHSPQSEDPLCRSTNHMTVGGSDRSRCPPDVLALVAHRAEPVQLNAWAAAKLGLGSLLPLVDAIHRFGKPGGPVMGQR